MKALYAATFLFLVGVGIQAAEHGRQRVVFKDICSMVAERFYRPDERLDDWVKTCEQEASSLPFWLSRPKYLERVKLHMRSMEVSHLLIYDPEEDRRLWRGEGLENGLRVRMLAGHWVVINVHSQSSAAERGVKPGDVVLSVQGEIPRSAWHIQSTSGKFVFGRGAEQLMVELALREIREDQRPRIEEMRPGVALFHIPSFRSEFFIDDVWIPVLHGLRNYQKVVLDLRGNAGGNIVAMLRGLSPWLCDKKWVGILQQPRKQGQSIMTALDDLDEQNQLSWLDQSYEIRLETFSDYGCFSGKLDVLIDRSTASVAEIFVEALRYYQRARVWGEPSAGDVLIATWYHIPRLGPGYSISIPEALFVSPSKKELEGQGVWPDEELEYLLEDALKGEDSWLRPFYR